MVKNFNMLDQSVDELKVLSGKVDQLLTGYRRLKAEVEDLKLENKGLKISIKDKEEEIKELEIKCERLKITGALLGDGGNARESKRKLGELLREIDRCIALLNR